MADIMTVKSTAHLRGREGQSRGQSSNTEAAESPETYGADLAPGARDPARYEAGRGPLRGRQYDEPPCPTRSSFQRDRDRVLHSTAFRRLTHKTQVFIYHEGDHFRSRLTHSLEVAQIARTIARQLRLNEDLAECLALAHDLGHPPFGHAGERALDRVMSGHGGFDHNAQSLRIVMKLEKKYCDFDGLNLTWEVLEGLAKHNGPVRERDAPIARVVAELAGWQNFDLQNWPSAEAQLAALADDIAYLTHDIDDGLRAGLLDLDGLRSSRVLGEILSGGGASCHDVSGADAFEIVRALITVLIRDVVVESRQRLRDLAPAKPDDIRHASDNVIAFSESKLEAITALRAYLFKHVYRADKVMKVMENAETIVSDLFSYYAQHGPEALPGSWTRPAGSVAEPQRLRIISDYLAGMTDRYAFEEHRRLFDATPELR